MSLTSMGSRDWSALSFALGNRVDDVVHGAEHPLAEGRTFIIPVLFQQVHKPPEYPFYHLIVGRRRLGARVEQAHPHQRESVLRGQFPQVERIPSSGDEE